MILLDTNIFIHGNQASSPHYVTITERLIEFADNNEELAICPQVLYEFYVVATRSPNKNGLGISNGDALVEIDKFMGVYTFIEDPVNLFTTWFQLMKQYHSAGKAEHDGRLVAFMQAQAIDQIYTMNPGDFNRYADIITILN